MFIDHNDLEWLETLLIDLDRARSLSILICIRNNAWDQLVSFKTDPSEYCDFDTEGFRYDNIATELLRKNVELPITIDREQAALDSFWESEEACSLTNRRLHVYNVAKDTGVMYHNGDWAIYKYVEEIQEIVKSILGPIPQDLVPQFSSGSTYADRRHILPMDKMSTRPTVTRSASEVVVPLWESTLWSRSLCAEQPYQSSPRVVQGNRFTTVPKTALTDRGICIEPSLNVVYQLPVGSFIRKRLRDHGIDLKFGQPVHQRLMESASMTRMIGTIDLSAASDSVSIALVRLLLPEEWFDLLNSLRSEYTFIEGTWHKNAKFSSMGNGFTFELETLIFYAICRISRRIHMRENQIKSTFFYSIPPLVYGDDIIVPVDYAHIVVKLLLFFGFKLNERKTWISSHAFRESCGSDFFNGVPSRGHYLETFPKSPIDWIKLANGLRRVAGYDLVNTGDLCRFKRSWLRVVSRIPAAYRCRGPVHLGDTVIHDRESSWVRKTDSYGTEYIRTVREVFADSDKTTYSRKFWTRGSIVSAALLGKLRGLGDEIVTYKSKGSYPVICKYRGLVYNRRKPFVKPRSVASGWKTDWAVLYVQSANYPSWLQHRDYGVAKQS